MSRSKILELPEDKFREIVARAASVTEILRNIGVSQGNSSRKTLQKRIEFLQIDASHLSAWKEKTRDRLSQKKIPLEEVLVEHSTYQRRHIKDRLIEEGLMENRCAICGLEPEWEGKELTLELDHINGIKDDNRLENLRLICPNCHSQTKTFSGRNQKRRRK
jgi:Zn finger protein HypA/HybF involved in hydrogenase expression